MGMIDTGSSPEAGQLSEKKKEKEEKPKKKAKEKKSKKGDKDQKPEDSADAAPADGEAAPKADEKSEKKSKKKDREKKDKRAFSPRRLLAPFVPFYRMMLKFREMQLASGFESVQWLGFPVISVGNISAGGTGKTPFVLALAKALRRHGLPVDILCKGNGHEVNLTAWVDPDGSAEIYGEAPLLMAQETRAAVYVGPLGYHAGRLAEKDAAQAQVAEKAAAAAAAEAAQLEELQAGNSPPVAPAAAQVGVADPPAEEPPAEPEEDVLFGIHLLHDGFQQRQLARHVDILLVNRRDWADRLMPAGTLREPHEALFRANAIAIPASEPEVEAALRAYDWQGPVWRFHRILDVPVIKEPVAAFCAIAHSDQFFESLEAFGFTLACRHAFPNHFVYTRSIVKELLAEAIHQGARAIVTTSKDVARLGALASLFPPSTPLVNARLRIEIQNIDAVVEWLAGRLA